MRDAMSPRWNCLFSLLALGSILGSISANECLTTYEDVMPKRLVYMNGEQLDIRFELSQRVSQRLVTRIMRIFLVEVLGYQNVTLIEKDDGFDALGVFSRLSETYTAEKKGLVPETMINMETWVSPHIDTTTLLGYLHVRECGSVTSPGYFGWFVPRELWRSDFVDSWEMFARADVAARFDPGPAWRLEVRRASVDGATGRPYCTERYCNDDGIFVPTLCSGNGKSENCALLLASYPNVTRFVVEQVQALKLYVKVAWVGPNLQNVSRYLAREHARDPSARNSIVVLHYTPSDVIPDDRDFVSVTFPRCGTKEYDEECPYVTKRLVKLAWSELEVAAKMAYKSVHAASFDGASYRELIGRYNRDKSSKSEETIACEWMRDNLNHTIDHWRPENEDKSELVIGGIFPMTGPAYRSRSILIAANMAAEAVNHDDGVLRDYNLALAAKDGQCRADTVMKAFIDYIMYDQTSKNLIGILGPACSETLEPLVGVATQHPTTIISYSAEGSSFDDRRKYPYFFRTIGENRQYKHVYLKLLQRMGWRRVAALTEDGQKYTEYIALLQDLLQENGITFVDNAKFPRERDLDVMRRHLKNLKQKRAKIIIADVYDKTARQVMCEAYKLEMTALEGYVWFLPLWLLDDWYDTDNYNRQGENVSCTTTEMQDAINGYFGLSHAYYAPDNAITQEGITVKEWRSRYESRCKASNQNMSNYAGYAYDATWTYAYAMDQLLRENPSYVYALNQKETVDRLARIIGDTDFQGVSGRIKFLGGASRISVVDIMQYVGNETRLVGQFHPNVSETRNEVVDGFLDLDPEKLVWLTGHKPGDGSEPPQKCVFAGISELLDVSCEVAIVIVNVIGFGLLGIVLIVGFVVVKKKYEEKVKQQEKYIRSLGIDLLPTDSSTSDKWEIPRECVVINRKLGEGAFGTVYGGEAFFREKGWLAVAVKTLKVGSSTDEKLDFLSEFEVMKRFDHKNIVKLLGVCNKCEPVYTVMEFMLYGDLKTYLLARRHLVNDRNYEDSDEISNKKLTTMALDVARALSYLAELKYVHRDVASRNCLINAQRVVKLGDFGMTRPMFENDYYKFNRKGMLPVRWMAPESLGLGLFTPASDVWSYGILLYEIITFGSFPFQGLSNLEVLEHVKSGHTLTIPSGVKPALENLIRSCWSIDRKMRPNAPEIVDFLGSNPRLLAPCLDVPLSSVQLEHTGELEARLPEKFRKFSVSLKNTAASRCDDDSPKESRTSRRRDRLVTLDESTSRVRTPNSYCEASDTSVADSTRPLLNSSPRTLLFLENDKSFSGEAKLRYVNLQPGFDSPSSNDFSLLGRDSLRVKRDDDSSIDGHDPHEDSVI